MSSNKPDSKPTTRPMDSIGTTLLDAFAVTFVDAQRGTLPRPTEGVIANFCYRFRTLRALRRGNAPKPTRAISMRLAQRLLDWSSRE